MWNCSSGGIVWEDPRKCVAALGNAGYVAGYIWSSQTKDAIWSPRWPLHLLDEASVTIVSAGSGVEKRTLKLKLVELSHHMSSTCECFRFSVLQNSCYLDWIQVFFLFSLANCHHMSSICEYFRFLVLKNSCYLDWIKLFFLFSLADCIFCAITSTFWKWIFLPWQKVL